MEKQSVEDSFKNAFHEAEMRPSSEVWTHIELGIEKETGIELKKRVVFYRWMAAASVLLAVSLVGAAYFMKSTNQNPIALQEEVKGADFGVEKKTQKITEVAPAEGDALLPDPDPNTKPTIANHSTYDNFLHETNTSNRIDDDDFTSSNSPAFDNQNAAAIQAGTTAYLVPTEKKDNPPARYTHRNPPLLPPLVVQRPYRLHFPKTEPDQIDLLLAEIEMEEKAMKKKREEPTETFWSSIAMAAGAYNSIAASTSNNQAVYAVNAVGSLDQASVVNLSDQVKASGQSFSSGISLGGKVSDRWVLQGGVNYLTQNSSYQSNAVFLDGSNSFKLASINTVSSESYSGFVQSTPYTVNSTLKYFNIPLQAGYLIVNKAFGWQMLGGISTDFFLQSTLSAEDAGLNKVSQSGGDDSPYRTVNFSGLLGTEISYRFGDHYRVAVNPGLRYPLQSIYKSEFGVNAVPLTFDVGLKFNFIFR